MERMWALITGASSGIGYCYAEELASRGYPLVIVSNEEAALCKAADRLARQYGVEICPIPMDLATADAADRLYEACRERNIRIDVLVNNAGITRDGLMMRMSEQQWDMVINVNLKSAFNFIHAVTPVMMKQKSGSIINMASVVGVSGNAGQCNYSASKAGLIGLAKSIAKELGPRGIRANAIAPGFIITDMTNALSDEIKEQWAKQIPLRRGGTPDDVAKVALFLASDLSSYVSGQVIHVCGAMNT